MRKIYYISSKPTLTGEQIKALNQIGEFSMTDANKWNNDRIIETIGDVNILIAAPSGIKNFDQELITGLKKLEFISLVTIGTSWVDLQAAMRRGILVSNAKGGSAESVAEHTWAMILDISKRVTEFYEAAKYEGAYKFTDFQGKEVFGKTLGIIGLGDIGKKIARIAETFNMKILGVNKSGKKVKGVELVSLDKLFEESDIIAVAVPLNNETSALVSEQEVRKMKDGVIVVNCAREEIVDKGAIIKAVKDGKVYGYGVETAIMTKIEEGDPYLAHPRIIVTPHNAFNTQEAEDRIMDMMIENIRAFIEGEPKRVVK